LASDGARARLPVAGSRTGSDRSEYPPRTEEHYAHRGRHRRHHHREGRRHRQCCQQHTPGWWGSRRRHPPRRRSPPARSLPEGA